MLRLCPAARSGSKQCDIKKDLSAVQLAGIGAVAIIWNEIEFLLDTSLYSGELLDASCFIDDLPKRKLSKKLDALRIVAKKWNLSEGCLGAIGRTIESFSQLKRLRNAVVHCRVFDASHAIGEMIQYSGDHVEVLLTVDALAWLYGQSLAIQTELRSILAIFDITKNAAIAEHLGYIKPCQVDPSKDVIIWLDQLTESQLNRESLGLAPQFPSM